MIRAVAPAWWKLLDYLKENPDRVFELPPRKFEELVAGAYQSEGWIVKLTPRSGDNGIDVIAEKPGVFKFRIHDQAKLYKPGRVVTAEEVRALLHTIHPAGLNKGASMGVVTTSSSFAPRIEKDPSIAGYMPHHLTLIDGEKLFDRLDEISKTKEQL
ncbi:restriction endonuclease [Bremerella volcania]|uniref:restriction endonuclease n=1 Tax=Bremerella volcania TaxID=2527984 RepID=UPI0013FD094E|nr:restriction endonuclease [Bremerella volcania]